MTAAYTHGQEEALKTLGLVKTALSEAEFFAMQGAAPLAAEAATAEAAVGGSRMADRAWTLAGLMALFRDTRQAAGAVRNSYQKNKARRQQPPPRQMMMRRMPPPGYPPQYMQQGGPPPPPYYR